MSIWAQFRFLGWTLGSKHRFGAPDLLSRLRAFR